VSFPAHKVWSDRSSAVSTNNDRSNKTSNYNNLSTTTRQHQTSPHSDTTSTASAARSASTSTTCVNSRRDILPEHALVSRVDKSYRNISAHNDSYRNDSSRTDSLRNDSPRNNSSRSDSSRNESMRNESSRNELSRNDASRNDSNRKSFRNNTDSHSRSDTNHRQSREGDVGSAERRRTGKETQSGVSREIVRTLDVGNVGMEALYDKTTVECAVIKPASIETLRTPVKPLSRQQNGSATKALTCQTGESCLLNLVYYKNIL